MAQNCTGPFICLGIFLCIFGLLCFGTAAGMGVKLKVLHEMRNNNFDECSSGNPDADYSERWWIIACPGVVVTDHFESESFPAICTCKNSRMTAVVLMALVGFTQFIIGIVFSCIGCVAPGSCCRPRKAWGILCGFVGVLLFFSFVSFVLALHFRMNAVNPDLQPNYKEEIITTGRNGIGITFTAFCGIDMFLNLLAVIMACIGFSRADKNNNQTAAVEEQVMEPNDAEEQGQGQVEGQRSKQPEPDNPPAYSTSQSNTSEIIQAKSQRSSRISNGQ